MANNLVQLNPALATSSEQRALTSLESWLPSVRGGEEIPADKAAMIPAARRHAERLLCPATAEEIAVEMLAMTEWALGFNIPAGFGAVTKFYIEGLKSMPRDLLPVAMERVRANHKWGMRLPLAAEIMAQVQPELDRRTAQKFQLAKAAMCPVQRRTAELTPEELKDRQAFIERTKANALMRMETHPTD